MIIKVINLKVAAMIRREHTEVNYNTWIKPIENAYIEDNNIIVDVENDFIKAILEDRYLTLFNTTYLQFNNELNYNEIIIRTQPHKIEETKNDIKFELKLASESKKIADIKNEEKIEIDATIKKILTQIDDQITLLAEKGHYSTSYMITNKFNQEIIEKVLKTLIDAGYTTDYREGLNTISVEWT